MIIETSTLHCPKCNSIQVVKNGINRAGNQQFLCKDCGKSAVIHPKNRRSASDKEQILSTYHERPSMRGIARIYHVSRNTLKKMLKEAVAKQPTVKESLLPAKNDDVLELDEVWSFVFVRTAKYWLWTALCRRTRQIVAFVIGDHSAETCLRLWNRIPKAYRQSHTFSDFWSAYEKVFPKETHRSVGKETGETAHMERWYCTLRQKIARYVRETLSFSKAVYMHHLVTRWFIVKYNLTMARCHLL